MTIQKAIVARRSVRRYQNKALDASAVEVLQAKIAEVNRFEYRAENGKHMVVAHRLFSLVGYTQMDMGIAKLHFEIGAGSAEYQWIEE